MSADVPPPSVVPIGPWKSSLECEWRVCVSFTDALVLFFGFLGKATGRTVRPIWTNEGSKRVVTLKEVPFGGLWTGVSV